MKKGKIFSAVFCGIILISLAGCGNQSVPIQPGTEETDGMTALYGKQPHMPKAMRRKASPLSGKTPWSLAGMLDIWEHRESKETD